VIDEPIDELRPPLAGPPLDPQPLDPRVLRLWRIEAGLLWAVAALVLGGTALAVAVAGGSATVVLVSLLALLLLGALAVVVPAKQYAAWRYQVGDDGLFLEHGVITRTTSVTPHRRIQHVDVASGPLERWLGLAHLVLHTASASTDAEVPGIPLDEAERLREVILGRAGVGDAV
jgi:hypothetical protein